LGVRLYCNFSTKERGILMGRNDGLPVGSQLIEKAKGNLTTKEAREWKALDQETSRAWRRFWIRVLKNHGHTNVEIAKEFEMSESSVRSALK
jgi:hypothetical protein